MSMTPYNVWIDRILSACRERYARDLTVTLIPLPLHKGSGGAGWRWVCGANMGPATAFFVSCDLLQDINTFEHVIVVQFAREEEGEEVARKRESGYVFVYNVPKAPGYEAELQAALHAYGANLLAPVHRGLAARLMALGREIDQSGHTARSATNASLAAAAKQLAALELYCVHHHIFSTPELTPC